MENYKVIMRNPSQAFEDSKRSIPINFHSTQVFSEVYQAKEYISKNKNNYDRIVLIKEIEGKQERIEHYINGQKEAQWYKMCCVN